MTKCTGCYSWEENPPHGNYPHYWDENGLAIQKAIHDGLSLAVQRGCHPTMINGYVSPAMHLSVSLGRKLGGSLRLSLPQCAAEVLGDMRLTRDGSAVHLGAKTIAQINFLSYGNMELILDES